MIPVAEPIFIDTNILVYANVASAPFHAEALTTIRDYWKNGNVLWVSRQVLREFLVVITRPQLFSSPSSGLIAASRARFFEQKFSIADETAQVTFHLLQLIESLDIKGKQVHDTNIVATMLANRVRYLLTHNVADFKRFSHLIEVIPLVGDSSGAPP